MSLRTRLPRRVHGAAQAAYIGIGRATAPLRMTPSFVMVGASRSGTTTLFRALSDHPQVLRPVVNKGVRYFDLNYYRPASWYYGHFPLRAAARHSRGRQAVTFEASGYYLFHPLAAERMASEIPDVKVVAMLRDPVERAWSAWKHESARGFEWESFERALDLEDERLRDEEERIAMDPTYESFTHRHLSHRSRGEYAPQVERFHARFTPDRVHIIESEEFFGHPETVYARLLEFLGLDPHPQARFAQHNARPSADMDAGVRRELRAHYRPYDERLAELLGRRLGWMHESMGTES